jgi:hypothetical protein
MAIWKIIFRVKEAGSKARSFSLHVNAPESIAEIAAQTAAIRANEIIKGAITSATIQRVVDLSGTGVRTTPLTTSDVEEGGRFIWSTSVSGIKSQVTLPTWNENYSLPSGDIDLLDANVALFTSLVVSTLPFCEYRGEDIIDIDTAYETFG